LIVSWRQRSLVFTNYRTRVSASADPATVGILNFFEDWASLSDLVEFLPGYSEKSLRRAIRLLLSNTLLVAEGTPDAVQDEDLANAWSDWLPEGSFHFATKDVSFLRPSQATRTLKRYLKESPQPARAKDYPDGRQIQLPEVSAAGDGEFAQVLMSRMTHREFSRQAIGLGTISKLLFYTWAVQGQIDSPVLGPLFHKTSPSGGARHPGEVYVLAMRVEGLSQGLYHYNCVHHRLSRLRSARAQEKAVAYVGGQEFVKEASALFIMTAVFPRMQWKYRFPRAYRVVLLDAGHLCQTFCLVSSWLGVAPFCTAALNDSLIERDLGIDGVRESVLYVAGVGRTLADKSRKRR
jgi:SagB-type dehydrogenase family enzyme